MGTLSVSVIDLTKAYAKRPEPAVDNVSFSLEEGESVGLLGPNGAGKTTLVKLIAGIIPPTKGTVNLLGFDPFRSPLGAKRQLGVVHQRNTFDMFLSGMENLRIAAAFHGLKWNEIRPRVDQLIDSFQMNGKCDQPIYTLSGGEQRRLQVIRAILRVPRVLLLDEPSVGLDVSSRRHVWALVRELSEEHGTTLLWTSHYVEELERNCRRVMIFDRGRIVRFESPAKLTAEFGQLRAAIRLLNGDDVEAGRRIVSLLGIEPSVVDRDLVIESHDVRSMLPRIMAALNDGRIEQESIQFSAPSLEDAYLRLVEGGEINNDRFVGDH